MHSLTHAPVTRRRLRPRRLLAELLCAAFVWTAALPISSDASAAPPSTQPRTSPSGGSGSASGSAGTKPGTTKPGTTKPTTNPPDGPQASGRKGPGGSYSTTKSGYKTPDFVYGGNALSFLGPIQIGLTPNGYIPRGRLSLQYDRQISKAHWVHLNVAALFDRGNWKDFRMDSCGLESQVGTCQAGTTAGMDIALGYTHKLFIEKRPWIVPTFRAGIVGGFWAYPRLGGTREQTRELSWMLGFQAAAGVRFFLLRELAIGIDVELRPGIGIHRQLLPAAAKPDRDPAFMLPLLILPLIVEWRF